MISIVLFLIHVTAFAMLCITLLDIAFFPKEWADWVKEQMSTETI